MAAPTKDRPNFMTGFLPFICDDEGMKEKLSGQKYSSDSKKTAVSPALLAANERLLAMRRAWRELGYIPTHLKQKRPQNGRFANAPPSASPDPSQVLANPINQQEMQTT